jgi:midasin (ATPase involved in ribosome maturation)
MDPALVPFNIILAVVSIIGFMSIIIRTFSGTDASKFMDMLLLLLIGAGILLKMDLTKLSGLKEEGLTSAQFSRIIGIIIAVLAMLTGLFNVVPSDRIHNWSGFMAIKGIVSIIAIIVIVIETWVLREPAEEEQADEEEMEEELVVEPAVPEPFE